MPFKHLSRFAQMSPAPLITDNTTFVTPLGLGLTIFMGLLVLVLPRRFALFPVMFMMCYMTMGIRVLIADLNFTMIRILLLFCWLRLLVRCELRPIRLNGIDRAMIWFHLVSTLAHTVLMGGYAGLKFKLGQTYDALGFYFFFRYLLTNWDDVIRVARMTAVMIAPLALIMVCEKLTLKNPFVIFGGVEGLVWIRDGVARCQGPFSHPILAGTFGAAVMPVMAGLWECERGRMLALLGICSATLIAAMAGSSGPLIAYIAAGVALGLWPLHGRVRILGWGLVFLLFVLHLLMSAPVWFLIGRVSVFNASTGWHRAYLIDRFINHFGDWWVVGTETTANWGIGLYDVTNHFIVVATDGGLLSLVLFLTVIVRCFRGVGRTVRRMLRSQQLPAAWLTWCLGGALLTHCVSFVSVSYFDQNMVNWYLLLALIGSAVNVALPAREALFEAVDQGEPVLKLG